MVKAERDAYICERNITGTIYDRGGTVIAETDVTEDGERVRSYIDPHRYTSLISDIGGLEYRYRKHLAERGEPAEGTGGSGILDPAAAVYKGRPLTLTIDDDMQRRAYGMIEDSDRLEDASAVVMDREGGILLMVNSNELDISRIHEDYEELSKQPGAFMNKAVDALYPCGSVLKPVIAELMIDSGMENFKVNDKGSVTTKFGETIYNANGKSYGEIGLKKALKVSSNVYFITAAERLGKEAVDEAMDAFFIGKDMEISDLGKMLSVRTDRKEGLALETIGQAVSVSPLSLVSMLEGIATGTIHEPHVTVPDSAGRGNKAGAGIFVEETGMSERAVMTVRKMLKACAGRYGLSDMVAKTGTADMPDGRQTAAMIFAWPADSPEYFAVIQNRDSDMWGKELAPYAQEIRRIVEEEETAEETSEEEIR